MTVYTMTIASRALCMLALLSSSCATIPKEASELSAELGKRVSATESAHMALLHAYFAEKRDRVDEFLMKEWVPMFASELMKEPVIASTWSQVCTSNEPDLDRAGFLSRVGPALQAKINKKRTESIAPLDELEREIEQRLRAEYNQVAAINNAVTSFLASASELEDNRNRLLAMLGVSDDRMTDIVDKVDAAVTGLVDARDSADKRLDAFKREVSSVISNMRGQ